MANKPVKVTEEALEGAVEDFLGWCPTCKEFTREATEPDAEGYDCPVCDGHEVVGAEDALIAGLIEVGE